MSSTRAPRGAWRGAWRGARGAPRIPLLLLAWLWTNPGVLAADPRAPRITEHPESAAGLRAEPLTLRCQADGRPAPNVSWTKDGKAVELQASFSRRVVLPGGNLFFLRLDPADAGAYRCVADNGVGEPAVSREAMLEVAYLKHEFRAAPSSQMVTAGDTVLLQCGPPRGRPDPAVQWRKDGRRLDLDEQGQPGERQPRLRLVDATNLAIRDARPADSGRYQCVAQNVAATRESPEASLQVAVPPHFVTRPVDTTALLGSSAVLRCEVAGDPKPSVRWHRAGQGHAGNASTRLHVLADRALRIAAVRLADAGVYVCDADNGAGVISASATLSVVSEPTLAPAPPRVLRLEPDSTATLRCGARGTPAPLVTWSIMGNRTALVPGQAVDRLTVSRDSRDAAAVATLQRVTRADSGRVLVCAAVNGAGAAVSRTRLVVLPGEQWPPPVVVAGPSNVTLPPRSAVTMPCRTASSARPRAATTVAWLKDGQPVQAAAPRVQQASSGALQIQDLQPEDAGEYTCVASSRSGRYRWRGVLRVAAEGVAVQRAPEPAALPGAPGPVRVNVTEHAVVLSWQRNAKVGSSTLQGYIVEVLARPAEGAAASAVDLPTWSTAARLAATATSYSFAPPGDAAEYLFLVRALNAHGPSPPSELVGPVARGADGRWAERGHGWFTGGRGRDDDGGEGDADDEDMADVQDALDLAPVVRLTEVVVASPTSVKALWDVLDPDQVEGLSIYWWAEAGAEANQTGAADQAVALQSLTVQTHGGSEAASSSSSALGLGLGFLVTGLRCYTEYHFFLVPFNQQGEGRPSNSARIRTLPGAPSAPPTRLEATLINGSTALVKWSAPPAHFQNGPLQSYQVVVQAGEPPELVSNVTLSEDSALQLLLSNLSHHSAYHVSVAAATAAGLGPFSAPLTVRPTLPVGQQHRHDAEGGGSELLTETWFMALLGSMVAVMVLLFSAIIFLHRRQHRASKETFLGFYDCGANGPVLTTPLTLKASEGMPHPLSAPLSPPLCLVPQDACGAKYRGVSPGVLHSPRAPHEDLMLPEYAEANDAQYGGSTSQGSVSSKSYYAEVRNPHMMSTFQSTTHAGAGGSHGGSHGGSQGSQRTGTGSSCGGGAPYATTPYATTTLVCSARTASTAPCSSGSTSWSQDNECCYPSYSDHDGRPSLVIPAPPQSCSGHYDNCNNYGSHGGSHSPLDHRDAAASLQSRCPGGSNRCQSVASGGSGAAGTLGRENRRLKLLRRQHNRSAHAKGLPPSGPQSSQLQLLLRSSPSSSRSGSTQGGSPPDEHAEAQHCLAAAVTPLRQEASDYHSSSSGSSGRRYGGGARSQARSQARPQAPSVAYSGLPRRGP